MTSNKGDSEGPPQDSSGTAQDGEPSPQVQVLPVPAQRALTPLPPLHPQPAAISSATTPLHPQPAAILHRSSDSPLIIPGAPTPLPLQTATIISRGPNSSHFITSVPIFQLPLSAGTNLTPPSQLIAKARTPARVSSILQSGAKPTMSFMSPGTQVMSTARAVVISVAKASAAQPSQPQAIMPPGLKLSRTESGQLIVVQQAPRILSAQTPRIVAPQVTTTRIIRTKEVTFYRVTTTTTTMKTTTSLIVVPAQKTGEVVGVPLQQVRTESSSAVTEQQKRSGTVGPVTSSTNEPMFSPETLESVKKCKSFLVTLIKLAANETESKVMGNDVKELIRSLLEGKMEAEEFTERLYIALNATPQPCLVPFLKRSLSAVRCLVVDPQLFIQQASTGRHLPLASTTETCQQGVQQPWRPAPPTTVHSRGLSRMVQIGKHLTGGFPIKQPLTRDAPSTSKSTFKTSSGSFREDDDINDVASMAGVNLREENAKILTSGVGSVVQSCHDQPFLSPQLLHNRILQIGQSLGVTEVGAEVVSLVSHATQERLRGLLEKVTLVAEHRKVALKNDPRHYKVNDVRSQLRFLEEVESLRRKKQEEEEKEKLLRLARSRSHSEDPLQQQLQQRAKELQLIENAQLKQKQANLTALAALGPRKKRTIDQTKPQVSILPRQVAPHRVTRRDLLLCLEEDQFLRKSLTFYKAMQ